VGPDLAHESLFHRRMSMAGGTLYFAIALVLVDRHFKLCSGSTSLCMEDTFGMAGQNYSRPYEVGVENLKCSFRHTDASSLEKFVLIYYPSIEAFRDFKGVDLVPETHYELNMLLQQTERWIPGINGPKYQSSRIKLSECDIPTDDGGAYAIQRVGPLVSTGNYDYWQFGWQDVWRMSRALKRYPEGVMFTSSFSGPVDQTGKVLGHPPIHIHHIHITPEPGVVTKMSTSRCVTGENPHDCYAANLAVEQHGDYQCTEGDGGIDCFFEKTGDGYAKLVSKPFDLEGEINDVRAKDSEPMTWWYQVVLRWFPRASRLKPLSQKFIVGPGLFNASDQRHNVIVFPVNTSARSMYWYAGYMEKDGIMVRNKLHSHNTMFDRAFFFRGTAEDLGLNQQKFWPELPYIPLLLEDLGYPDFMQLQEYLFNNLAESAKRYDERCSPIHPECVHDRPALICQSWVSNEDFIDPKTGLSFAYDRRAPCCCRPWHFTSGDPFIVVAFMQPLKYPPGPWVPHKIPPTANMHIHWLMTYETFDNRSHYGVSIYNQNPEKQVNFPEDPSYFPVWAYIEMQVAMNGLTFNHHTLTLQQRLLVSFEWFSVSIVAFSKELVSLMCVLALGVTLFCGHVLHHRAHAKRAQDHCMVQCADQVPCCTESMKQAVEDGLRYAEVVTHDE